MIITKREERSSGKPRKNTEDIRNGWDERGKADGAVEAAPVTKAIRDSCAISGRAGPTAQDELFGGNEGDVAVDGLLWPAAAPAAAAGFATAPGSPDATGQVAGRGGDDQEDGEELVVHCGEFPTDFERCQIPLAVSRDDETIADIFFVTRNRQAELTINR